MVIYQVSLYFNCTAVHLILNTEHALKRLKRIYQLHGNLSLRELERWQREIKIINIFQPY